MPKVTWGIPQMQKDIEADLRSRHGGMMTASSVGEELGVKHHTAYEAFLRDVPVVMVNGRKRYRVSDVAKKIFQSMEVKQ